MYEEYIVYSEFKYKAEKVVFILNNHDLVENWWCISTYCY
jgi:hypothetical protein